MSSSTLKYATLSACALLALPGYAHAADGPYLGVEGGPNWEQSQNLSQAGRNFVNANLDSGYVGGVTAGWQFASGLRLELEFDYRRNNLRSFNSRLYEGGNIDATGFETAFTGFGNVWYDFKTATGFFSGKVHPYIGVGIGVARIGVRNLEAGGIRFGNASATVFAYQAGAGIDYDVTPRLTLSIGYRFMQTSHGNFGLIPYLPPADVHARYRSESLMIGLRYALGS